MINPYRSILILLILATFFACESRRAFSQDKPILRWAADAESGAPYVFSPENRLDTLIGFEADIVRALADSLDMEPRHFQNQWDGLIPGFNRDDYEIVINGIEITCDRKEKIDFSVPYYYTYERIIVRADDAEITSFDDLQGKNVGTLEGCLAEMIMDSVGGIKVRTYDSEYNSFTDLKLGRLDAVLIDAPVAIYYAAPDSLLKLVGEPVGDIFYGIAIRKGDTLLPKINRVLRSMTYSGELKEILVKWKIWDDLMWAPLMNSHVRQAREEVSAEFESFSERRKQKLGFWEVLKRYISWLPGLVEAAWMTLKLSVASMILAVIVGIFLALSRVYAPKPISKAALYFIELIRGTPLLMQLFFIYYIFPNQLGITGISPFVLGVLALGINYAAYEAENYRAGLFSVPKGQMEAAVSLGMSKTQALRHIIIPQAVRLVIPPLTNDFISLLKDSSLVSVIAMVELTKYYGKISSNTFDYIGSGIIVAAVYLLLGLPFVKLSKYVEKKFALDKKSKRPKGKAAQK